MNKQSSLETHILGEIGRPLDLKELVKALSFAVAYASTDDGEKLSIESIIAKEDVFQSVIHKLKQMGMIEIKSTLCFDGFSILNLKSKQPSGIMLIDGVKEIKKKISKILKSYEQEHTKFEARYFWKANETPEIVAFGKDLFDSNAYQYKETIDSYMIGEGGQNIKIRGHELQIKEHVCSIQYIGQYLKKKKIPLESEKGMHQIIDVIKKRYIRKLGSGTKIEFANITVKGENWKTLCIESKSLKTLLTLSLLIRKEKALQMTYVEFLKSVI